jgi:hypothetical protein
MAERSMNSDLWRWTDPDGQQRKVRFDELRAALAGGLIAPNTPVWRSGWSAWQPAHEVPELTSASVGGANGVLLNIPPPPLAMLAVQQEYEATSGSIAPARAATAVELGNDTDDEPPPPPRWVPLPSRPPSFHPSSSQMKTVLGGSAHIPAAPGVPAFPGHQTSVAPGSQPRLGSSLPTTIGIPPPPELLAAVNAANAPRPKSAAPPPPKVGSRPPPPPKTVNADSPVEELSGSMLLDASSGSAGMNGVRFGGGLSPSDRDRDANLDDLAVDRLDEVAGVPRRAGLEHIIEDLKLITSGKPPKNKLVMGILGAVALSFVIMLIAGIASLASGPSRSKSASAAASASERAAAKTSPPSSAAGITTTVSAPTPISAPTPATEDIKPTGKTLGDCAIAGETKTIAMRAQIASGIEAHAMNGGLALGFAPGPRDGVTTMLDASSLAPTSTARTKPTGGDTRRVTPVLVGNKLNAIVDVDRKGDKIGLRRVVAASTLVDIGQAEGGIVWAPHGRDSFAKLFGLDGDGAVEALRGTSLADRKGIALAFRRGNSINVGVAKGENSLEAEGDMSKIAGTGQVGSPAIAVSGDRVIVAWADRTGNTEDWGIRWAKLAIGSSTTEATSFTIPEGGLGGQAMSPSIAPLGGGRFFLVWTEGPVSSHQIRGLTFGADGSPSGSPVAISPSGVNAGQPAVVVGPDGRGAVAFLAAKGKVLEVHATPISCPPAR